MHGITEGALYDIIYILSQRGNNLIIAFSAVRYEYTVYSIRYTSVEIHIFCMKNVPNKQRYLAIEWYRKPINRTAYKVGSDLLRLAWLFKLDIDSAWHL